MLAGVVNFTKEDFNLNGMLCKRQTSLKYGLCSSLRWNWAVTGSGDGDSEAMNMALLLMLYEPVQDRWRFEGSWCSYVHGAQLCAVQWYCTCI